MIDMPAVIDMIVTTDIHDTKFFMIGGWRSLPTFGSFITDRGLAGH
jgi:hypothetical protein